MGRKTIFASAVVFVVALSFTRVGQVRERNNISRSCTLPKNEVALPENIWTQTSEGMEGANISAIAVSPGYATDKTIFVGTYMFSAIGVGGTVYKSTNGGASWQQANEGLQDNAITVLTVSPNYPSDHTLFAGTLRGMYRSTDGGASWETCGTFRSVDAIAISPNYANDHTIFVAADEGVYKSTDGGTTWSGVYIRPSFFGWANALAVSPAYAWDQTVFLGTFNGEVFKSTNAGDSWESVGVPSDSSIQVLAVSPNYAADQIIFVGNGRGEVYKSDKGGLSWTLASSGLPRSMFVDSLAVSPSFAMDQTLYIGNGRNGVYKSTNAGASWSSVSDLPSAYRWTIALSPSFAADQTVFAGSSSPSVGRGGVFKSADGGTSWEQLSDGLLSLVIRDFAFSPGYQDDGVVFAATSCGGVFKSTDHGVSWTAVNDGFAYGSNTCVLSLAISPNYLADGTLFAGTSGGIYKSIDGGNHWNAVLTPGYLPIGSFAISPNYLNDHTIFAGIMGGPLHSQGEELIGILKSSDGGDSWSKVEGGDVNLTGVQALAISPNYANDHTIFAGTDFLGDGVCKSIDGGISWSVVNAGLSTLAISALAISPDYQSDQTIFAAPCWGVFKSTNGGSSWIYSGLSGIAVKSLTVSPNYGSDTTIFAGTDGAGVYQSVDDGLLWRSMNNGFTNPRIYTLAVAPTNPPTLFAGTVVGVWQFPYVRRLQVKPISLLFLVEAGTSDPAPRPITVEEATNTVVGWTAVVSPTTSWLTVNPASGSTPSVITTTVNISGLELGSYQGYIQVETDAAIQDSSQAVTVTVVVAEEVYYVYLPLIHKRQGGGG